MKILRDTELVAVDVGGGLIVWHTRAEWAAFKRGVDVQASVMHDAPLEYTDEPMEET